MYVSVNRHTSITAVCYHVTLPYQVRICHFTPADLYAFRILSVHPSAVQLSDRRAALQVQLIRSAAVFACEVCAVNRAAAALSTA
jgi:hypothetical protein